MPIKFVSNNRILPANARAEDVAKKAVNRILDVQAKRYQAAFGVQGFDGVFYSYLTSGIQCACCTKDKGLDDRGLQADGKASAAMINELLTGGAGFGVRDYGRKTANTLDYAKGQDVPTQLLREGFAGGDDESTPLAIGKSLHPSNHLPSVFELDEPPQHLDPNTGLETGNRRNRVADVVYDIYTVSTEFDPVAGTVVPDGVGTNGPVDNNDLDDLVGNFDISSLGLTDVSCPICFGSNFVGGFSIMNGWRKVLNHQFIGSTFGVGGYVIPDADVVSVSCHEALFPNVVLPFGCVGVDSLRAFNGSKVIPASFEVDGTSLEFDYELLKWCDGKPHNLRVLLTDSELEQVTFSHLEIQLNQSEHKPLFEFPKIGKSSNQNVMDPTDDFQIILSPKIPTVKPKDIVTDSSYGKVYMVKDVQTWNDRQTKVLGWEANVRVCQPTELFDLLPRRRPLESPRVIDQVTDNDNTSQRRT